MVEIRKEDNNFVFEVKGMHKLWAFKNQLTIPADHILNAHQDIESIKQSKGWRMPGTYVPGIITAGTYIKDNDMIFWDVCNKENSIIVELQDEEYKKLIIEVEAPEASVAMLKGK